METKQFKIRSGDDTEHATFEGYASTWTRTPDSYGDVVKKGAFKESLAKWEKSGRNIPVLWGHNSDDPNKFIAKVTHAEEDEYGLKITGEFFNTETANTVRELLKNKVVNEMSFAYDIQDHATVAVKGTSVRELRKVDLHEVSVVMTGANPETNIISVKTNSIETPVSQGETAVYKHNENLVNDEAMKEAQDVSDRAYLKMVQDPSPENVKASAQAQMYLRKKQARKVEAERAADLMMSLAGSSKLDPSTFGTGTNEKGLNLGSRSDKGRSFAHAVKQGLDMRGMKSSDLVNGQPIGVTFSQPIINDPRAEFTLAALLNYQPTEYGSGQYLRQTVRDNKTSTVPRHGKKPVSRYELEAMTWELSTIAHISEPVARQWFDDMVNLTGFLSSEMAYGVAEALDGFILLGGTTESGATAKGILNETDIEVIEYETSPLRTLRRAIGSLNLEGVRPTGIALHPTTWEEIEMTEDADGRPLLAPAGEAATQTLWGVPVTLTRSLDEETAIVADWQTITLLDRGRVDIRVAEQGLATIDNDGSPVEVDMFSHNQVVMRAEARYAIAVSSIPSVRTIELA